jgi:hypothetical protein
MKPYSLTGSGLRRYGSQVYLVRDFTDELT